MKIAFIGLGAMGYPMAGHLHKKGFEVTVYNRTENKSNQWVAEYSGTKAPTPKDAADDCDCVLLCVGNDEDVRSVVYGESGVLAGMKAGCILVDHTTTSAYLAEELEQACTKQNASFLDAPVSGGEAGAQRGMLTVMLGGTEKDYNKITSILDTYSQKHLLMGPVGSGQKTKMVNQICIGGLVQALSEGMNFARRTGLDTDKVIEVIGKGAAQSWQMDNRAKTMLADEFNFGFAVDWMIKDLGIVLNEANNNNSELPITELVYQYYQQISKDGNGRFDTSSLITLLNKKPT